MRGPPARPETVCDSPGPEHGPKRPASIRHSKREPPEKSKGALVCAVVDPWAGPARTVVSGGVRSTSQVRWATGLWFPARSTAHTLNL